MHGWAMHEWTRTLLLSWVASRPVRCTAREGGSGREGALPRIGKDAYPPSLSGRVQARAERRRRCMCVYVCACGVLCAGVIGAPGVRSPIVSDCVSDTIVVLVAATGCALSTSIDEAEE